VSSTLFFVPAIYAYFLFKKLSWLGFLSSLTGAASIHYWWYGDPNWRLTLDKTVAYITALSYWNISIWQEIQSPANIIFPLTLTTIIAFLAYRTSCYLFYKGLPYWVYFHIGFHVSLGIGKCVVIRAIYKSMQQVSSK